MQSSLNVNQYMHDKNIEEEAPEYDICESCGNESYKSDHRMLDSELGKNRFKYENETLIQCDFCKKWYHGWCVDLQDYEHILIDKFHCPACSDEFGQSTMQKVHHISHRYKFDDLNEKDLPIQVGTMDFVKNLKTIYGSIPETSSEHLITVKNGFEFEEKIQSQQGMEEEWTRPYKVLNSKGLGLEAPNDPNFDVSDILGFLGEDLVVEVVDVFAQDSTRMTIERFNEFWMRKRPRERVYNIISLEFSETSLSNCVKSPSVVQKLSWAFKYWPTEIEDEDENSEFQLDHLSNTFTQPPSFRLSDMHKKSRPFVEHYCLIGMQDSYTDFHVDFGGSSVWYHVFRGEKVFFLVPPTDQNLKAYEQYQKRPDRDEIFFGDVLQIGQLFRLHVHSGETIFMPSGWIHAVWTPVDSIVFGGNFLHSNNVEMQLRIYTMEMALKTEERLKFPYFERINWYAANEIATELNDRNNDGDIDDKFMAHGLLYRSAVALLPFLKKWLETMENEDLSRNVVDIGEKEFTRNYRSIKTRLEKAVQKQQNIKAKLPKSVQQKTAPSSVVHSNLTNLKSSVEPFKNTKKKTDTEKLAKQNKRQGQTPKQRLAKKMKIK